MTVNKWRTSHLTLSLLILTALVIAACGGRESQQTPEVTADIQIDMAIEPNPPAVGEAELIITLTDTDGDPVTGATVEVRGDMNHAGMIPVLREVEDGEAGVYTVPFEWTMGGDWILTVTATLPDGVTAVEEFEISGVSS
ncbi:MAG: FixH family protein [Chloroflexota bacterium]